MEWRSFCSYETFTIKEIFGERNFGRMSLYETEDLLRLMKSLSKAR
jgi:hypothetical protein